MTNINSLDVKAHLKIKKFSEDLKETLSYIIYRVRCNYLISLCTDYELKLNI